MMKNPKELAKAIVLTKSSEEDEDMEDEETEKEIAGQEFLDAVKSGNALAAFDAVKNILNLS